MLAANRVPIQWIEPVARLVAETEAAKDAEIAALSAEYADAVRALAGLDDYFDQRADADAVGDPQRYVGNTDMHRLADIRRITSTPRARAVLEQGETT